MSHPSPGPAHESAYWIIATILHWPSLKAPLWLVTVQICSLRISNKWSQNLWFWVCQRGSTQGQGYLTHPTLPLYTTNSSFFSTRKLQGVFFLVESYTADVPPLVPSWRFACGAPYCSPQRPTYIKSTTTQEHDIWYHSMFASYGGGRPLDFRSALMDASESSLPGTQTPYTSSYPPPPTFSDCVRSPSGFNSHMRYPVISLMSNLCNNGGLGAAWTDCRSLVATAYKFTYRRNLINYNSFIVSIGEIIVTTPTYIVYCKHRRNLSNFSNLYRQ